MMGNTNASSSGIDVGFVMGWLGANDPESGNWLILDGRDTTGTAIELQTVYPKLYKFLGNTNVLPDFRGEFLRGAGNNSHSGQGNGGSVGEHQDATRIPLTTVHPTYNNVRHPAKDNSTNSPSNYDVIDNDANKSYVFTTTSTSITSGSESTKFAARPTNTSINWAIRAR